MPVIENIKPVTVAGSLSAASSFTSAVNVPFVADTVEVASYVFKEGGGTDTILLVRSSLFGAGYSFGVGATANTTGTGQVGAEFPLHGSVSGPYTFELLNPTGTLASATGTLVVTLIFRKYRGLAPK